MRMPTLQMLRAKRLNPRTAADAPKGNASEMKSFLEPSAGQVTTRTDAQAHAAFTGSCLYAASRSKVLPTKSFASAKESDS